MGRVGRECCVYFPAPGKKNVGTHLMVLIAIKIMKIINDKFINNTTKNK